MQLSNDRADCEAKSLSSRKTQSTSLKWIEYPNEADRRVALSKLVGVEDRIFIEVEGQARVYALADEDLERTTSEKTSAVHFLRIPVTASMKQALKAGAQMMVGCDHKGYPMHVETLPHETLASLVKDLDWRDTSDCLIGRDVI